MEEGAGGLLVGERKAEAVADRKTRLVVHRLLLMRDVPAFAGLAPAAAARLQVGFSYRHDPAIERLREAGGPFLAPLGPPFLRHGRVVVGQPALVLAYLGPRLGLVPADELVERPPGRDTWIVPCLNVDGLLAGTRKGIISQRLLVKADGTGRVPAIEIMVCTNRIRDFILDPDQASLIGDAIKEGDFYGMQTFDQALLNLYEDGLITLADAAQVASNPHDFKLLVQSQGHDVSLMTF